MITNATRKHYSDRLLNAAIRADEADTGEDWATLAEILRELAAEADGLACIPESLRDRCCDNPTKVVLRGSADASCAACGAEWPEEADPEPDGELPNLYPLGGGSR